MSSIAPSGNGFRVLVALEEATTGDQVIFVVRTSDLTNWGTAYDPQTGGSSANVRMVPANEWGFFLHGNFDTDVLILLYDAGAETVTDLSPAGLGAKECNTLVVNPTGVGEAWATIDTDEDLLRTTDAGSTWPALDAVMGFDPTALDVLWSGGYALDRAFIAGKPASVELQYTPGEGADKADQANAGLAAVANICSIVAIPA